MTTNQTAAKPAKTVAKAKPNAAPKSAATKNEMTMPELMKIIGAAKEFTAYMMVNKGLKLFKAYPTLREAGVAAIAMEKAHPGKRCLVSAIDAAKKATTIIEAVWRTASKAEAPKETKPAAESPKGKRSAVLEAAKAGTIPAAPDFTAETHKRFRPKLAEVVAMVEKRDLKGLRAFQINAVSSSPKAIAKYRDLAVIALEAQA